MLSIQAIKNAEYYLALAVEDYFLYGGEPTGVWVGNGARRLKLGSKVAANHLRQLMKGFAPDGKTLVQNAGFKNRQAGWDLTFSAPKSVSVMWANLPEAEQQTIQRLHFAAVKQALHYLEQHVSRSRIGKAGKEQVAADLVVATFEHGTSRALDPQLHTHALVLNLGVRRDGTTGTIVSHSLYKHKKIAGALYRLQLAAGLREELGLKLIRKRSWFEIEGIPGDVLRGFSTRRKEIEHELSRLGVDTASAAAFAALNTRKPKDTIPPREDLFRIWQLQSKMLGFSVERATKLIRDPAPELDRQQLVQDALTEAINVLEEHHSHFSYQELLMETTHAMQETAISIEEFLPIFELQKAYCPRLINLGVRSEQNHYTTPRILKMEQRVLESVVRLSERTSAPLPTKSLNRILDRPISLPDRPQVRITLRPEQAEAVRHLASGNSSIRVVTGMAGTGKTAMLLAAKEAFEAHGYKVLGLTPTHRARQELANGAGIDTDTISMRLLQFESAKGPPDKKKPKRRKRASPIQLDSKSVLVLDEASMVDTPTFEKLLPYVEESGARLLLVGDEKQLPPVGLGGVFDELVAGLQPGRLAFITRQKQEWAQEMVFELSQGRPERFLREYAARGYMKLAANHIEAQEQLIRDWRQFGGAQEPHRHIIAASTNAQVDQFNDLAQQERLAEGILDSSACLELDDEKFYVGDRVTFRKNARRLHVFNGDIGTVVAIRDWGWTKAVAIQLDGDEPSLKQKVTSQILHHASQLMKASKRHYTKPYVDQETRLRIIPIRSPWSETYRDLRLAYAFTTHKLQGASVDNMYVALGEGMTDRELSYVQGSRHRESLRLYTTEEAAGPLLTELVEHPVMPDETMKRREGKSPLAVAMEKSRKRKLATRLAIEATKEHNHKPKL